MKKTLSLFMVIFMLFTLVACGNETPEAEEYCWSCGGNIAKQAAFCEHCGVSLKENSTETTSNNGTTGTTQTPTDESSGTGETPPSTCNHSWKNATCTDVKICTVCLAKDPDSKPLGHSYVQGKCERCGADDTNYAQPTITANKTSLNLDSESSVVYITMTGGDSVTYDIGDTSIVNCEWGEWDGDTIPLTFIPISSGETSVTVFPEGYDDRGITIYVTVDIDTPSELTTLTIEGKGNEFKQYITGLPNTNKLHSITYKIEPYVDDEICIWIDYVVSCIDCVEYNGYIRIRYNLYNSNGVVVETGLTITEFTHTNTQYAGTMVFSGLPADDYTLVFSDAY